METKELLAIVVIIGVLVFFGYYLLNFIREIHGDREIEKIRILKQKIKQANNAWCLTRLQSGALSGTLSSETHDPHLFFVSFTADMFELKRILGPDDEVIILSGPARSIEQWINQGCQITDPQSRIP